MSLVQALNQIIADGFKPGKYETPFATLTVEENGNVSVAYQDGRKDVYQRTEGGENT
jgi:hypothetical protein